jgi:hypothetical protein
MAKPSQEQIAKAVDAFVNAPTWKESKHIVEAQRDILFTEAADQFLASLLDNIGTMQARPGFLKIIVIY